MTIPTTELQKFDALAAEVVTLVEPLREVVVDSAETRAMAMTSGRKVKELLERFEETRMSITRPLDAQKKLVMDHVSQITVPLVQAKDALARKIAAHDDRERKRLQEEQRRIEEENRKRQRELDKIEAEARALAENDPLGLFTEEAKTTTAEVSRERFLSNSRADLESKAVAAPLTGSSLVWTMEVTDPTLIPREFLVVNEVALRQAFRANPQRVVPGARYFQKSQTVFK